MTSVRSEKKMVLKEEVKATPSVNSHNELVNHALDSALPFFDRKIPESMILPCLDLSKDFKTLNAINGLNKQAHKEFSPLLKLERLQRFQNLLNHVAHGNQEEAKKIIALHPSLLLLRGTVKTYAGDTVIDVNPVELAWGEEDDSMVKMMQPYMNRLASEHQTNLFKQLKERFPETKAVTYDFEPLVSVITRRDAKTIETALNQFKNDFAPRIIRKEDGKYLNRVKRALEHAIFIYECKYDNRSWSDDKCSLFWCKVIGFLQRRLSACYAQAYCQGLHNVTEGGESLRRNLKLNDGSFYFAPLTSTSGLGSSFGIRSGRTSRAIAALRLSGGKLVLAGDPDSQSNRWRNLCRKKTAVFRELMYHLDSHEKKRNRFWCF